MKRSVSTLFVELHTHLRRTGSPMFMIHYTQNKSIPPVFRASGKGAVFLFLQTTQKEHTSWATKKSVSCTRLRGVRLLLQSRDHCGCWPVWTTSTSTSTSTTSTSQTGDDLSRLPLVFHVFTVDGGEKQLTGYCGEKEWRCMLMVWRGLLSLTKVINPPSFKWIVEYV